MSELVSRLHFALEIDYLHATRYRGATRGDNIEWRVFPDRERIKNRDIVVVDDILDEGETLAAIKARLLGLGAAGVQGGMYEPAVVPVQLAFGAVGAV